MENHSSLAPCQFFKNPNWSIFREETDHDDCSGRIMESDDWNLI